MWPSRPVQPSSISRFRIDVTRLRGTARRYPVYGGRQRTASGGQPSAELLTKRKNCTLSLAQRPWQSSCPARLAFKAVAIISIANAAGTWVIRLAVSNVE